VALAAGQRSFDDIGAPLAEVTFVVIDLETTGGSPETCAITEIGALKLRGGQCLGTFHTLVNPGVPVPPLITVLTGITEAMVLPAPPVASVLPALLEFFDGAVLVGHNLRFDISFLDAALAAHGYPRLASRTVDTIGLARRLVRDEVPNLRLATLARHLRAPTEPIHRALEDARATVEVFHALLERAGTLGVLGLDDLLTLPSLRAHPSSAKLKLTTALPRRPGVYLFHDPAGRVLYVGKATNLRARVRSYFSTDERRKVPQLLRETAAIDYIVCEHQLKAAVREIRLIHTHEPRFNRRAKVWRSYAYLKLTLAERFPRLTVVRNARADGALYIGPLYSLAAAHLVREAVETAVPLRRCASRIGRNTPVREGPPCVPAQLGVAVCPCRGHVDDAGYAAIVATAARGLTVDPPLLLGPLEARMRALADASRYEEAALTRDRLRALAGALARRRLLDGLRHAGRLLVEGPDGVVEIVDGRLVLDDDAPGGDELPLDHPRLAVAREELDERLAVARWLVREASAGRLRLREAAGTLASALPVMPSYEPAPRRAALRPAR
jgi:DNA polymerase-3 subunit epsilon